MRERNHWENRVEIETTLWELVAHAIREVGSSDDEAVLEASTRRRQDLGPCDAAAVGRIAARRARTSVL